MKIPPGPPLQKGGVKSPPFIKGDLGGFLDSFSDPNRFKGILPIIGERPGTTHYSYSVYITVLKGKVWTEKKVITM